MGLPSAAAAQPSLSRPFVDPDSSPLGVHDLYDVSGLTTSDAWAVGTLSRDGTSFETWIQHWDGQRWDCIGSHGGSGVQDALYGVATVAADDAWAVGAYQAEATSDTQALIEHWDGARWSVVRGPRIASSHELRSVAAVSAEDLWAVGGSSRGALTLHFDGTRWRRVDAGASGRAASFHDVTALASDDVWAVGTTGGADERPLIEHWDGSTWSTSDVAAPEASSITSVSGTSSDDVWAVGLRPDDAGGTQPLLEHWDGAAWTLVPGPSGKTRPTVVTGVAAISADDAWVVGYSTDGRRTRTLTEHWDGSSWRTVDSADGSPTDNRMYGVDAISSTDVLTVGSYDVHGKDRALTEQWDGRSWSITP